MSTIIRRDPSNPPGKARARRAVRIVAVLAAAAVLAILALAWYLGGPQQPREVAVPLSVPAAA